MAKDPILVVMAAGMGSRYGGLKQIDAVGCRGEAILDYSLYDAYEAGFRTAVIIIKKAIEEDFMEMVGNRLKKCPLEIRYAYQELTVLPEGYTLPEGRTKPLGTSHALLCAKEQIGDAPFAVVNADDYYGKSAYRTIYQYLSQLPDDGRQQYCMVGYKLHNTVTMYGTVARAVCEADADGNLTSIVERTQIRHQDDKIQFTEDGQNWIDLPGESLVSMNLWGFAPGFLDEINDLFPEFMDRKLPQNPQKAEFLLPTTVSDLLTRGKASVKVLQSSDTWYGVTYAQDKPIVMKAFQDLTANGLYPRGLWEK